MPSTPVLALPYPAATDTADVPRDIQALAVKLDGYTSLRPALVTSLPGSPVDGQEVYFVADATNGVVWHLRYNAAESSVSKWELIGGSPMYAEHPGDSAAFSTAYAIPTPAVAVTAPLRGDYLFQHSSILYNNTAGMTNYQSLQFGATAAVDTDGFQTAATGANQTIPGMAQIRKNAVAAATLVSIAGKTTGGGAFMRFRHLTMIPVRVG
jgi:hypothetical protein